MRRYLLLLFTLPFLLGAKGCGQPNCKDLRQILELAKASGTATAIEVAEQAITAAGGCPLPEPTPTPVPSPTPEPAPTPTPAATTAIPASFNRQPMTRAW